MPTNYIFRVLHVSAALFLSVSVFGCSGSFSDPQIATGQLIDSPVQGANYVSGSQSGVTGPSGEFTYEVGRKVQFSIGNIELGEVDGKKYVSLLDLASDGETFNEAAINIARLLQSLDSDPTDDRITIPDAVLANGADLDFADLPEEINFADSESFNRSAAALLRRLTRGVTGYPFVVSMLDGPIAQHQMERGLEQMGIHFQPADMSRKTAADLTPFSTATELSQYLKNGLRQNTVDNTYHYHEGPDIGAVVNDAMINSEAAGSSYSTTNIQERGVDEADIIKTDGEYLYIAPVRQPIYYMKDIARPVIGGDGAGEQAQEGILILQYQTYPPGTVEVNEIPLDDHENQVDGLYLLTDRGDEKADLLITVGGCTTGYWSFWYMPWYWQNGTTEVALYIVDTPETAELTVRLSIEGQLLASRLIGETLYLVSRFTPRLEGYKPIRTGAEDDQKNEQLLTETTIYDLLPDFFVNNENVGNLVRPENCYLPPLDDDATAQPGLITVTAIDLNNPENPVSRAIAGPTETVYVATDALYLATTKYNYRQLVIVDGGVSSEANIVDSVPPVTTDLHKFDLTVTGPAYRGSGKVPGNLGWHEDKKPYRMSHYHGVLRIATSIGSSWDLTSSTRLTLLREEDPEATRTSLAEISAIDGIGLQGEQLYAARFLGDRAYLVTYRITDPLYVFDLSDAENPFKAGELKIEGYSDYLHPISDSLLIGIGKDAIPDQGALESGRGGAWYQGVKIALFDVSDPEDPQEVESLIYGARGSNAGPLSDHHALAYLPPGDDGIARLAMSIQINDTTPDNQYFDPVSPSAWYDWTHTGLYWFGIDTGEQSGEAAITELGSLIVEERSEDQNWTYGDISEDRAVLLRRDESIHYIHNREVWSTFWD